MNHNPNNPPEVIIDIQSVENYQLEVGEKKSWSSYDGYRIHTSKQDIYILIGNGQSCCENYGYFSAEDNPKDFLGANLLYVERVDKALNVHTLRTTKDPLPSGVGEDEAIFITLHTSKGPLQFGVYNSHNGYYGHQVLIKFDNTHIDEYL